MLRTLSLRLAAVATIVASVVAPSALNAQKALVYCPVGIDAGGCTTIVAALNADATRFPDGADAGYDGTQGTLDLATADFSSYAVFVVPSLADGPDAQPYALLRNGTIAGRLQAAFVGRVAVWSGTPDVGTTNRASKDALIRNLAGWSRADAAGTHGPGVVALQDNSDDAAARYGWLAGISQTSVTADNTLDVYSNVQVLTSTATAILTGTNGLQIGYTNMASFGLVPGSGARSDATGGRSSQVVLVTAAGEPSDPDAATVATDKEDYPPGETVTVTGAGWLAGETVTLRFYEDTVINLNRTLSAVADESGHILNAQFVTMEQDVGVRFVLVATGETSGKTAQTTFTDGTMRITAATPTPFSPNQASSAGLKDNNSITARNQGGGNVTNPSVLIRSGTLIGGALVRTINITGTLAGNTDQVVIWDGKNDLSAFVADGQYTIRAVTPPGTENDGNNDKVTVIVDNTNPVPAVTTPAGVAVAASFNITGTASDANGVDSVRVTVLRASDNAVLQTGFATTGNNFATWSFAYTAAEATSQKVTAQAYDKAANNASVTSSNFAVAKGSQTITFAALGAKTFGDADFTVSATATSGLTVTFAASGNCTVTIATVHLTGAGSCTITASQAGNANFLAATDVPRTFTINKANQTIAFDLSSLGPKTVGDVFDVSSFASASSGLAVSFSTTTPARCTVTGAGSVTITSAGGQCTIVASQGGNANYNPAPDVSQSVNAGKASQTITFAALADKNFGDADFTVTATASSGLTVTFTATGNCTVTVATVHLTGAGSCTITAAQAGNADYLAAPSVPQTFSIAKATQTITFAALANKTFGDADFTVSATASSGLTVSFAASGKCTVNVATVHLTGGGSCTITASQAGNANFFAAPDVPRTFSIGKADQTVTITSTAPVNAKVGDPDYTATATSTSGLVVSFQSQTTGVCTSGGPNGATFHFVGGGTCTVAADQAGNDDYNAATQKTQSFGVTAQSPQTITFTSSPPVDAQYGGSYTVTATATSGLTVEFSSLTTGVCEVTGSTVDFVGVGTCTVAADQPGNASFLAAPQKTQTFNVGKADQTINFAALADKTFGDADFGVSATASSGLAVSFTASGKCTIATATVHLTGAGSCTITAHQAGNTLYNAAPDVPQTFSIAKAAQVISFGALGNKTFGDDNFTVSATGGASGNDVTFGTSTPSICSVTGSTVHIIHAGGCTITADQAGNDDYEAAEQVSQGFTIAKAHATIALSDLMQTYDGTPRVVTATTTPANLTVVTITYNGSTTAPTNAGDYPINASLDNQDYEATDATGSLHVEKATPVFTNLASPTITFGDPSTSLSGTISKGSAIPTGSVAITLNGGAAQNAAITAGTGNFSASFATGTLGVLASPYAITYHYAGDLNFKTADGTGSLTVIKADQTITFGALGNKTYGDAAFTVGATASSGLTVSFTSQTMGQCTVSGTTVTIKGAGTCTIRASQVGNDNYNPAPDKDQSFTIYKAPLGVAILDAALQPYNKSVYYADAIPAYSVKYTGFVYSDDQSVLGGTSTFGYYNHATTTKVTTPPSLPVGSYDINAWLTSPNYTITVTPGSLQILAWTVMGFYAPVDVPAGGNIWNTVKGGATVPLKFEIFSGSHELTDPNTAVKPQPNGFTATAVSCPNSPMTDDIEFTTTGGTVLRYDATAGQFIQNWQTPKKSGTCYKTTMTAQDGSTAYAYFMLK
jgi:hypothetical protein